MDKIQQEPHTYEETILLGNSKRKKATKSLLNNAGIFVGVFLMFAVVVVVTTDIRLTSFEEFASLALDFFILLFCSYSMYINCADSGMRAALIAETYTVPLGKYDALKKDLIDRRMQSRLPEFCRYYVEEELRNSRISVLAVVGFSYEEYMEKYVHLDKETIKGMPGLSKAQKKALNHANAIEPITLTPEMIMKRGRGSSRRAPLGMTPEKKKGIAFGVKFATTFVVSLFMVIIVLEVVGEPTWAMFASVCLKLITIVANGFAGYKLGFENIVCDTVNYMSDQTDLMQQAVHYIEGKMKVEEK